MISFHFVFCEILEFTSATTERPADTPVIIEAFDEFEFRGGGGGDMVVVCFCEVGSEIFVGEYVEDGLCVSEGLGGETVPVYLLGFFVGAC